jgi:hypothetical protein
VLREVFKNIAFDLSDVTVGIDQFPFSHTVLLNSSSS